MSVSPNVSPSVSPNVSPNNGILNSHQEQVVNECIASIRKGKRSMGLALPLGYGKTRISTAIGLRRLSDGPILVIVSKTLLTSWKTELDEVFKIQNQVSSSFDFESLEYEIFHRDFIPKAEFDDWKPKPSTQLVLTTTDVLCMGYTSNQLKFCIISSQIDGDGNKTETYCVPNFGPFGDRRRGLSYLYSVTWGTVIIDEAHRYTNISSTRCKAIACVYSKNRLALSGTMFDEPTAEKFLGFFVMMHIPNTPRALFEMQARLREFEGFQQYIIYREDNEAFVDRPIYTEEIVAHDLTIEEGRIYQKMKDVLKMLNDQVTKFRQNRSYTYARKYSAYILALITYIRQCLITPLSISSLFVDLYDVKPSELSPIVVANIKKLELTDYFNDDSDTNLLSSRFQAIKQKLALHRNDRVIIFSCFRSPLTLLQKLLKDDGYNTFTITAKMKTITRRDVLHSFAKQPRGVLFLPYDIGAEGLNLQCASVVMLMDMWWNSSKMQQAIGRVNRPGQRAKQIFVYIFVSNTGIENALIKKNGAKNLILNQLRTGKSRSSVPVITVKEIINFILNEKNKSELEEVRNLK